MGIEQLDELLSRRSAVQKGALAAGVLWTAPLLRSVRLSAAAGTAPPTTTTEPDYTSVALDGTTNGTTGPFIVVEGCPFGRGDVVCSGDISPVGPASVEMTDLCAQGDLFDNEYTGGSIHVAAAGATLDGTLVTGSLSLPSDTFVMDFTFNVTNGSGTLAGATGTLHYVGYITEPGPGEIPIFGPLTGTLLVPVS